MKSRDLSGTACDAECEKEITKHRVTDIKKLNPGPLESESVMTINTVMGKSIILGRPADSYAKTIIGLHRFNNKAKSIYYAAKADNPYADLILLIIEQDFYDSLLQYKSAVTALYDKVNEVEVIIKQQEDRQFHISHKFDLSPLTIKLEYKLQYGHLVALLISYYDRIVTLLLKLQVYGEISKKDFHHETQKQGKPIRRIYRYGQFWKNHKITRSDVRAGTSEYQAASRYFDKTFGIKLTSNIMSQIKLPQWGPDIRK